MNNTFNPTISEEMLAAWMDGNVTPAQDAYISQMCSVDPAMREIMAADSQVEEYYDNFTHAGFELPDELLADFTLPHVPTLDDTDIEPYPDTDIEPYPDHDVNHYNDEVYTDNNDMADNHDSSYDDYGYQHGMDQYDSFDA